LFLIKAKQIDIGKNNMRGKIIAANWKMNLNLEQATNLMKDVRDRVDLEKFKSEVIIFPPSIYLESFEKNLTNSLVSLGAQDLSANIKGAYTGEISAQMLDFLHVEYALIGHSERRLHHKEDHDLLTRKVNQALQNNLKIIFACGETLEEKESRKAEEIVVQQVLKSLNQIQHERWSQITIAYEPVWAIGTGKTATPEDANSMHRVIREALFQKIGHLANDIKILYGGSVKPENAGELFKKPEIDGALVGGASLNYLDFIKIINAAE